MLGRPEGFARCGRRFADLFSACLRRFFVAARASVRRADSRATFGMRVRADPPGRKAWLGCVARECAAMSAIGWRSRRFACCRRPHRAADARGARQQAAGVESLGRRDASGRAASSRRAGFCQRGGRNKSGRAGCEAGRRESLHRLPSARERALHAHAAFARPACGEQGRSEHSGVRNLPRPRLGACAESHRRRA